MTRYTKLGLLNPSMCEERVSHTQEVGHHKYYASASKDAEMLHGEHDGTKERAQAEEGETEKPGDLSTRRQ